MKFIESPQNEKFKLWKSLLSSKGIQKFNQTLVFGERVIADYLTKGGHVNCVLELSNQPTFQNLPSFSLSKNLFDALDIFGIGKPILVVPIPEIEVATITSAPQGLELICQMKDPSNLGAALRSAAAFDAQMIWIAPVCSHPFHPKSVRASVGAVFQMNFKKLAELPNQFGENTVALDLEGEDIVDFQWPKDCRILMGEEGLGLSGSLQSMKRVYIPLSPKVESLNVSTATTIALYAYRIQNR